MEQINGMNLRTVIDKETGLERRIFTKHTNKLRHFYGDRYVDEMIAANDRFKEKNKDILTALKQAEKDIAENDY